MNRFKLSMLVIATALLAACASAPSKAPAPAPAAAVAAKPAATAMNISGAWTLNVQTPMGARDMKLTATQTGEVLTGAIANPRGDSQINGTVRGNAVAFSMK